MEAITETVATVSDSEQLVLQASTMSAGTEIKTADIIEFRLPAIHEGIIEMAEQFVKQTLASFIETITQITDKTGNTVQSEDPIEGLIMAIEDLEMEFDDDGRPTTQIIVHPDTYKKFEEAEQTASPELLDKLAKILERKRKEYIASRRSRQLPRLSY
jgi:hypothetical protein